MLGEDGNVYEVIVDNNEDEEVEGSSTLIGIIKMIGKSLRKV